MTASDEFAGGPNRAADSVGPDPAPAVVRTVTTVTSDVGASDESVRGLRLLVAVLVAVEALVLVGLAVFLVVETFVATATEPGGAIALAALALILGAGLGACAYGLFRGWGWTRAPVVTWQLLQAGVAMPLSASERWYVGIPLLAVSVLVLGLLLTNRVITPEPRA